MRSVEASRAGLTIFELLLVLAIMVLVAAMSFPLLQRSFQGQKTISAADRVRAECGRARVSAIRENEVYAFFYMPGGNQFAVAPFANAAEFVARNLQADDDPRTSDFDFEQERLPRGIIFAGSQIVNDVRSQMASEQSGAGVSGMRPILFYPDGQCQSAEVIVLSEETGESYRIKIRGLTGTTSVSEISDDQR